MFSLKNTFFRVLFFRKISLQLRSLEVIIGFKPNNEELYRLALRHRSMTKSDDVVPASNERLEFLGDAILTAVVSEHLYNRYPLQSEGDLTKMRTKLVNGIFLNELALDLKIDELLEAGIGEKETPRSIYGDALEALIGAVYIDRGYKEARDFVLQRLLHIDSREEELMNVEIDHKSKLIEWAQKTKVQVSFEVEPDREDNKKYRAILLIGENTETSGLGNTKKEAEQNAARAFFELRQDL